MTDFQQKVEAIRALRKARQECEDTQYALRVRINKLKKVSLRSKTKSTVLTSDLKAQLVFLNTKIKNLEMEHISLNKSLGETEQVLKSNREINIPRVAIGHKIEFRSAKV